MIHTLSNSPEEVCEGCGKVHDAETARLAILAADASLLVCKLAQKLTDTNVAIGAMAATRSHMLPGSEVLPDLLCYHRKLIIVLAGATHRYIRRDLARHDAVIVEAATRADEGMTVN